LLDGPFAGIDPIAVTDIKEIISRLRDKGISVLIIDHNVRETLNITDWAYKINEGKTIATGQPQTILNCEKVKQIYHGEQFSL
tara:strand:- start:110 stop:358 length:249 start_codon:yes stop_codon:yes gene_type:complete